MKITALECIDFYKADHRRQYPEGTEFVYSNFTPRSSRLYSGNSNTVVFFGLQGFIKWFLKDLWNDTFFLRDKEEVLNEYRQLMDHSLGKDAIPIEHIEKLWELGYLPLEIKALPEGSRVGMKVPVLTVRNTHEKFFWLVNYLESVLSAELWKSCTNATIADEYKQIFLKYAIETGAPLDFVPFQGHDFSFRGMSGVYDAASSGAAHLTSFVGTDTVPSIRYAANYYNADMSKELIGCSVPASEHSVMCMGTKDSEIETFKRFITELYPTGIVSIVSDTWDFWKVITKYTVDLKEDILNRTPNEMGIAKTVFRPDSGNPVDILCGTYGIKIEEFDSKSLSGSLEDHVEDFFVDEIIEEYSEDCGVGMFCDDNTFRLFRLDGDLFKVNFSIEIESSRQDRGDRLYFIENVKIASIEEYSLTNEQKGAVECLWDIFGGTTTDEGYKVLNERVGLIYGDSITLERAEAILKRLKDKGFASCNVVFGIGSYTYQYNTRDTFGFAMKATHGVVNGEDREIFKDPITDSGTKKSAKGLLRVEKVNNEFVLFDQQSWLQEDQGELKTVFLDGGLTNETSLSEIRERLANH